jgi:non-specific serine/threonine protein kinase
VLHKDLKPANLVVSTGPQDSIKVKLTDFGSGRVIDEERLRKLEITRLGFTETRAALDSSSGTPLYFAPELIAGHPPSTRSDIFALGVILYQLIIGDFRRPLAPGWERDVDDELLREDIAACADTNPLRRLATAGLLSERLGTLAVRRVVRAAERERAAEAEGLRLRVARLQARRGALIGLVATLIVGLAVVSVSLLRVRASERRESAARAEAEAVSRFLEEDVLAAADPEHAGAGDVPIRVVLDRAADQVGPKFSNRPLIAATVHATLGSAYEGAGDSAKALREIHAAIDLSASLGPQGNVIWATAMNQLAEHYYRLDDFAAARKTLAELIGSPRLGTSDAEAAQILTARAQLGAVDVQAGSAKEGLREIEQARDEAARRFGPDDERTLALTQTYSALLGDAGRHAEAVTELQAWIAAMQRTGLADTMDFFTAREALAQEQVQLGRESEALPTLEDLYREEVSVLGSDNIHVIKTGNTLAVAYDNLGMPAKSEHLYQELIVQSGRRSGEDADLLWATKSNLATLYMGAQRYTEALPIFQAVYEHELRLRGEAAHTTLKSARDVARTLQWLGRWEEAAVMLRKILALAQKSLDPKDMLLAVCTTDYARSLGHLGQVPEARRLLDKAIADLTAEIGPEHRLTKGAIAARDELPTAGK